MDVGKKVSIFVVGCVLRGFSGVSLRGFCVYCKNYWMFCRNP